MRVHVVLNNFQGTSFAELDLNEGLTIIKGSNNQGKSTLIRAFEAVIFNNPRRTKTYIKNGESSCSVLIEVEGYLPIKWSRTVKKVTYTIGDKHFQNAGKLQLKDVYPDNPFSILDSSNTFNIIGQGNKPIPFEQTSSQVFTIFEELYGILSTKEDSDKFNSKISRYKDTILEESRVLETTNKKIDKISEFLDTTDVNKLKNLKNSLEQYQEKLNTFKTIKTLRDSINSIELTDKPVDILKFKNTLEFIKILKSLKDLHIKCNLLTPLFLDIDLSFIKELNIYRNLITTKNQLMDLNTKHNKLLESIKNIKTKLPICPTCKKPL